MRLDNEKAGLMAEQEFQMKAEGICICMVMFVPYRAPS